MGHLHRSIMMATCLMWVGSAHSTTIDSFDTPQSVVMVETDVPADSVVQSAGGDIIGGERDTRAVNRGTTSEPEVAVASGILSLTLGANEVVNAIVAWDGLDGQAQFTIPTGLGGIDLTDGGSSTGFRIGVVTVIPPIRNVFVDVHSDNLNSSRIHLDRLKEQILTPETVFIPFADFATQTGSGAEFSNVGSISLFIQTSAGSDFAIDGIETGTDNVAPVAEAGASQSVTIGSTVNLDGSGSSDDQTPSEDLTYAWTLTSVPAGSTATLTGAATTTPSFVADVPGDYTVELVVTDGGGLASDPDTVTVSWAYILPSA